MRVMIVLFVLSITVNCVLWGALDISSRRGLRLERYLDEKQQEIRELKRM